MFLLAIQARRLGVPFDEWWEAAVRPGLPPMMMSTPDGELPPGCVLWPTDSADRNRWRAATDEAREGWMRAYEKASPLPPERALIRLMKADDPLARLFLIVPPAPAPAVAAAAAGELVAA